MTEENDDVGATTDLEDRILSALRGCEKRSSDIKTLRKTILLSLQTDEKDKDARKKFKKAVQSLENVHQKLTLNEDGLVQLKKSEMKSSKKKKKKDSKKKDKKQKKDDKKRKRDKNTNNDNDNDNEEDEKEASEEEPKKKPKDRSDEYDDNENDQNNEMEETVNNDYDATKEEEEDKPQTAKNAACKGNNLGITRLFLGNLPFTVDDTTLKEFLLGEVTHIKWITDKETGRFYGSAFIEMRNSRDAAQAVSKNDSDLMGRPMRINYAPSRPGDVWPPKAKVITGGGQAGGSGVKAMREKPADCVKMFVGNLSYEIDDDKITKFFASVEVEMKAVRWQHHKDSGDFKGCAFVEFWNTEACEKAGTLNGKNLLARPIRMDWSD
uniref:RRM domain-containing protein n=1 Tax=Eucampia antarctica TaxID=49252 RepID=A0A7S2VYY9_9STRA|mmetsp:Transcript_12448/g.12049  ORF Transcript_12448/g.12049 Transcript_12448/m.12049 type:complete len:381 (+) Transcript_12448:100-1242(+)|eukprot:CAMPEP_0197824986 /NCGR_PEP_ID=MMETSP1437-20131217/2146_1 /TAXON_ID=49252 ORGANISM="Eucampia antarctica, Strain CCMP1452" /NCGR_SAMPLE_ID=MMETSP1437 /ASSEMBLY_ACC=CAM_ASM_001096 /LENGTH=380 /DNA_ID=CAMNT_0043424811 /DNA_START=63 /DNA_END=1205 /DNA_ORIENTATION=+